MKSFLSNRWVHFFFLLVLLIGAVWGFDTDSDFRQRIRYAVFDSYQKVKPRTYHGDVTIVDYDDESLGIVGQWPWPRNITAKIIDNLTKLGASSITFDGVLAEPDRNSPHLLVNDLPDDLKTQINADVLKNFPNYDDVLAQSIRNSRIFVAAFTHGSNKSLPKELVNISARSDIERHFLGHAQSFEGGTAQFLPELQAGAAGNGSFIALADIDGLIRQTNVIFTDGQKLYPSLSLEALRVSLHDPKTGYVLGVSPQETLGLSSEYRLSVGRYSLPIDEDGRFWIYYKVYDRKDYVSAFKVLDEKYFSEIAPQIKGKIILIGSSAEGLKDLRSTPVNKFLPGVEVHANAIGQILHNEYLFRPKQANVAENQFILVTGMALILLAPFTGAVWLGALCFFVIGFSWYASWHAFLNYGALIDPLYPSIAIFIIFSLSTMLSYIRTESERRRVREAFGLYISPAFIKELTRDPDKLKLGGETRDLSIMFTDIRNFTTISEGLKPEELIQLMNDFLTPMSDLVMQNRGTIDKYIGDAMMAFWNAPLDDPDHAHHACATALSMQSALEPINDTIKARGGTTLLKVGIGINSGPCAVGNMGSKQRFAYSSLGDAVNLAARLEGQTKAYSVPIIIGETTQAKAPGFAVLELDLVRVKGKTKPARIFALLGNEKMAGSAAFQSLKSQHDEMLTSYRSGDFKKMETLAQKCHALSFTGTEDVYKLYMERAEELMQNPPANWDGIYDAKNK